MTEATNLGDDRGGEGAEGTGATEPGAAAQPPVITIAGIFQYANNAFAIEADDAYGTRKTFHLRFEDGAGVLEDTMPDVRYRSTPYGGENGTTGDGE